MLSLLFLGTLLLAGLLAVGLEFFIPFGVMASLGGGLLVLSFGLSLFKGYCWGIGWALLEVAGLYCVIQSALYLRCLTRR